MLLAGRYLCVSEICFGVEDRTRFTVLPNFSCDPISSEYVPAPAHDPARLPCQMSATRSNPFQSTVGRDSKLYVSLGSE